MITFKIHQIKDIENTDYSFMEFKPDKFNFSDYEERYEAEFVGEAEQTDLEICETLFTIFNFRKPEDFKGHSLSMVPCVSRSADSAILASSSEIVPQTVAHVPSLAA